MDKEIEFLKTRGKMRSARKRRKATDQLETTTQTETVKKPRPRKKTHGNAYRNTKTGAREDLGGIVVRSNWEANCLRVLDLFQIQWQFEPIEFRFPPKPPKETYTMYIPDIYLPKTDEFIEIKGYLDARGRNKLRKFKKHYPNEFAKLIVVISKSNKANNLFFTKLGVKEILYYEHISKLYGDRVNWEGVR